MAHQDDHQYAVPGPLAAALRSRRFNDAMRVTGLQRIEPLSVRHGEASPAMTPQATTATTDRSSTIPPGGGPLADQCNSQAVEMRIGRGPQVWIPDWNDEFRVALAGSRTDFLARIQNGHRQ